MIGDAVSNNDLALWWCQWLLQVQFTFMFEKTFEVDVHEFLPGKMEGVSLFSKKAFLRSSNVIFDSVELSWVSR